MSDLLIRNVPPALQSDLKDLAKKHGRSLSDEAKDLLTHALLHAKSKPTDDRSAFEILREAFSGSMMTDEEHEEFIKDVEEMRRDEGRRVDYP
ncbi:MAG: plasmid stabilization protein [Pseudomonadota bacterium]